jgi:predicted transcriptional regulator
VVNQEIHDTNIPDVITDPTEDTGNPINIQLPENIDPIQFAILMLGLLALLLIRKIKSAIQWLIDRFFFGIIFVVGAFYNIQDRIIDHNDVFLNQTRTDIMEYLEKVTYYGAHLREIKSVLGTGTGSLLWHLQILEEFGWITQIRVDRFTVFLPTEFLDDFDLELKTMELKLQSKHTLIILETLLEVSGSRLSFNDFIEETGINKKSARRLLRVLEGFELVELVKQKVLEILLVDRDTLMELLTSFEIRNEFKTRQTSINVKNLR